MASGEIYSRALLTVRENRQRRIEGGFNSIPWSLERFGRVIPGVQRKNLTIVSAATGVGKSKLAKVLYALEPYEFVRRHPEAGIKFDLFWFGLEENKENFMHSVMVYKLYVEYGLVVPIKTLKSIGTADAVDEIVIEKVEEMREWFEGFERHVRIIDNIRNPTGIYKEVEDYLLSNGHWEMKEKIFHIRQEDGSMRDVPRQVRDKFIHDHPQHYVGVVVDHLALLHPEKGMTLHQTMTRMSSDYGLNLRDKYDCWVTFIVQQAFEVEEKQYTYRGALVEARLEPRLQTLGDNKLISRDADEAFALFAPDRYDIETHRGYQVLKLQDNYRSLQVLKSRDGESNVRVGLFFDGRCNQFAELPKANQMDDEDYEYFCNRAGRTLTPPEDGQQSFDFS